ncbi:MAG TPA: cysteine synthase family protein [Thermoplasmata archaeon]|nr:cysteine synthase family protein [Thermoplasmata archaeon]
MYSPDPAALTSAGIRTVPTARRWGRAIEDPFVSAIGNTPLVPLSAIVANRGGGFEIWAKAEHLNPTGSVKDRTARGIVLDALANGQLSPGRTLVDASSGNTAVAYAMLGARLGFPVELVLPSNAHRSRIERIRAYGARVVFTDPTDGTDGAQREARRRAAELPDLYFYPDQYNNPSNPRAHYSTTGPEIWSQVGGRLTHFVAGVGTGGTISGVSRFLKERNPSVRVVGVEPLGPLHGIEGLKHLPTALRPSTYEDHLVDETVRVETEDALEMQRRLAQEEGLSVGSSAGAAVWAAVEVGKRDPGSVVVTILPDGGHELAEEGRA